MAKKYTKKPVTIEALQWTGSIDSAVSILDWVGDSAKQEGAVLIIRTLEGELEASLGDYIIKGVKGGFYPCKPDIFEMTYEKTEA